MVLALRNPLHKNVTPTLYCALVMSLGLLGCHGDGSNAPPQIQEFTLGATTHPLGSDEAIHGVFEFTDPDGDAASIAFEVRLPDGTVDELPPEPVDGLGHQKHGTVSFSLIYSRDTVGRYEVTVWLLDAHGTESNRLTGTTYSRM